MPRSVKRPERIIISGCEFSIEWADAATMDSHGELYLSKTLIKIAISQSEQFNKQTLFHELTHAAQEFSVSPSDIVLLMAADSVESLILPMGNVLWATLVHPDNAAAVKYMIG